MQKKIYKILLRVLILFCIPALGKAQQVVIVYSATETAKNPAYDHVITGINKILGDPKRLEINEDADVQTLLDQIQPDKIIALGKSVVDALYHTSYRNQTFAGMMYFKSGDYVGVDLALDSGVLAAQIARLLPAVKRVFIIQQANYQTIIHGSVAYPNTPILEFSEGADSLTTIRILGHRLEQVSQGDAVFIPANLPNNILYEVAKIAWEKKILLLSTNLNHLELGVLMVVYPSSLAVGEQLGLSVINHKQPVRETTQGLSLALNPRVAQHLEIEFDQTTLDLFDLTLK